MSDLGGGTFDASLLLTNRSRINGSLQLNVLDTGGDNYLGGKDFKEVLRSMLGSAAIEGELEDQMAELCRQEDRDMPVVFNGIGVRYSKIKEIK